MSDAFEALAAAVRKGDAGTVETLLDADPALLTALADLLLDSGADANAAATNAMRVTPVHAATSRGDAAMVKKLLDKGADPDARQQGGWTALHNAAAQGNVEIVRLLRAKGADVSARTDDGKTAADLADERGHSALAESLPKS